MGALNMLCICTSYLYIMQLLNSA